MMRLGSIIAAVMLGKLAVAAVKKSRETSPDVRQVFSGEYAAERERYCALRPERQPPDTGLPDHFTPYVGADMTRREADEAGFEFELYDAYHGLDVISDHEDIMRILGREAPKDGRRPEIPCCVITGYHGSGEIVKIPRSIDGRTVIVIEEKAFYSQKKIREIYLPDDVLEIKRGAFAQCSGLVYARLSKYLKRIGREAFMGCTSLERLYPSNPSFIDDRAFAGCTSLKEIRLADRVNLGDRAFYGSGVARVYSKFIDYAGSEVFGNTPYWDRFDFIVLGETLQKCSIVTEGDIFIGDWRIRRVDRLAFAGARARKVILENCIIEIMDHAFLNENIKEVYAPGAVELGRRCFSPVQRVTVSDPAAWGRGYMLLRFDSLMGTNLETRIVTGSRECPIVCYMYRNILLRVTREAVPGNMFAGRLGGLLTFKDGGRTLVMDSSVSYTAEENFPAFGAKKLVAYGGFYSWHSLEDFTELEFHSEQTGIPAGTDYRPPKTVTLRFKFKESDGREYDSPLLLYVPNVTENSREAQSLYRLYNSCLKSGIDFERYDSEILSLISSWYGKFTAARMRLTGGYCLSEEAGERYWQMLSDHRKKAEFIAKKHNDAELLDFLENIEKYN